MKRNNVSAAILYSVLAGVSGLSTRALADPADTTFFVTSVGKGNGGDLGGIDGADAHCQSLAKAGGSKHTNWRAYLSTQGATLTDTKVTHARDRIGKGPWQNAKGVVIAKNVEDLHLSSNNVTKDTALDEKGQIVNGRTEKPNKHDLLTGSRADGTAFPGAFFPDMTCGNWTKSGAEGAAMTGHHDRGGLVDHAWAMSWNSSHPTRGCSQEILRSNPEALWKYRGQERPHSARPVPARSRSGTIHDLPASSASRVGPG